MLEKYKKHKSRRRVSFHLGTCSLIFFIFAIIAKEWVISLILALLFICCLSIYLICSKTMNIIEIALTQKCINCDKDIFYKEENKYLLYGQNVSKNTYDNDITNDKKKINIKKYICEECKLCFCIVETYQLNNKGTYTLLKKEKHMIKNYTDK